MSSEPIKIRLKWISREKFRELLKVANYIGKIDGLNEYHLDANKCLSLGIDRTYKILKSLGIKVTKSELEAFLTPPSVDKKNISISLELKGGDLIIKSDNIKMIFPYIHGLSKLDPQDNVLRAKPMYFFDILKVLKDNNYQVSYSLPDWDLPNVTFKVRFILRDYQKDAYAAWEKNNYRGIIVLPTGSGKTIIGLWGIQNVKQKTLIVVPTIDLLYQWKEKIGELLGYPDVGIFGAGEKEIKDITVTTYSSAYLNVEQLSDKFGFVIFDEVHHLPSEKYAIIAEGLLAYKRLGLSATPERTDNLHLQLETLVGPIVFRLAPKILRAKGFLAEYEIKRIYVDLPSEIAEEYKKYRNLYLAYAKRLGLDLSVDPFMRFEQLIRFSGKSKIAHNALVALEKSRKIALNADVKIQKLNDLLKRHRQDKVLIFTRYTDMVYRISTTFGIPLITHKTTPAERKKILNAFKEGQFTKLVTGEVLDEGTDVPDANVAIIVSGTGSQRQYIQRLGRILRPKEDKALLYELITRTGFELMVSKRRYRSDIF